MARTWQSFGSMMSHQSLAGCKWLVGNAPLNVRWFSSPGGMGSNSSTSRPNKSVMSMRKAGVGRDVMLVHQAGVEGADEGAAVLDVKFQAVGLGGSQQMQRRRENDFVLRNVLVWPREVHRDVAVVQRVVDELDVLAQAEKFVRLVRLLQGPVVFVAVKNADFGNDLGVLERGREQFQFVADLADFHEHAVVALGVVREDGAVEFFAANPGLTPAEIKDAARAARDELIGEEPDESGPHERIHVLPVDLADFLFHGPETAIAVGRADVRFFERAQHVNVAGQFGGFGLHDDVAFDGDKINDVRPCRNGQTGGGRSAW